MTPLSPSSSVPVSCQSLVPTHSSTAPWPLYCPPLPWLRPVSSIPSFTWGHLLLALPASPSPLAAGGGGSLARRSHCPSAFNPPGASCCFQIPTARDTVQSLPAPPREWPGSLWPPSLCLSHHTFLCSPHPPITQLVLFDPGSHLGLSCSGWVAHSCKSSSYLRLAVQHLLTQEVRGQVHHVPHSQYAAWRLLSGHL